MLSNTRLGVFAAGVVAAWLVFATRSLAPGWLGLAVAAFLVLVVAHDRAIRARRRAERAAAFYEAGLARLEDRWAGHGEGGDAYVDPTHLYAEDLDLFGKGSLFQLLCTTRTRAGEATLAAWLLAPAAPPEIRARQAAVEELRGALDLREEIALLGEDLRASFDRDSLVRWGAEPARLHSRGLRAVAAGLASLTTATLLAWIFLGTGPLPFIAAAAFGGAFAARLRGRVQPVLRQLERPAQNLAVLAELLRCLEAQHFRAPRLVELRAALEAEGLPPSRQIARLVRLATFLEARANQFFAAVSALLLGGTQLALAAEAWRTACGPALARWVEAAAEIEALCALASYAREHPADPFPEIAEAGPVFDGEALGHPLIPEAASVRNDVRLDAELRVFLVSGSNMSGKSTLLRTVGVNAVLAQAGAPVRARRLRISPLAVGSCIRVHDSLQEGASRFYAEITRLERLVKLAAGSPPLLFLLDEILHGTNSHDRRIGAEAVVRGLLERGALGLVTTHDLALAQIAEELAPRAVNVHFEDHIEDGKIAFDYRLRTGVVKKSNALALMRAVGLEV